jgi:hypothetical protein
MAALAIEAAVRQRQADLARTGQTTADPVQARLDQFAQAVRQVGTQLAGALHRLGPPGPLPPLRELQSSIRADGGSDAVFAATDGLVDALDTTADTLRNFLAPHEVQSADAGGGAAGHNPAGHNPAGHNPAGHNPAGHNPGGSSPA